MGICTFCGDQAGWFKNSHPACVVRAEQEAATRSQEVSDWKRFVAQSLGDPGVDTATITARAPSSLDASDRRVAAGEAFGAAIAAMIRDKVPPTREDMARILEFAIAMGLVQGNVPRNMPNRSWLRFVMLTLLADFSEGILPDRVEDPGLGFAYERGEKPVWVFGSVTYLEDQAQRVGGRSYRGVSLRVMEGLYVHSGYSPEAQIVEGLVEVAEGNLVVTDRAMWFDGPHSVMRIWLEDILQIHQLKDGIAFCCKGGARNRVFMTGVDEGWFAHALITRLMERLRG